MRSFVICAIDIDFSMSSKSIWSRFTLLPLILQWGI